MVQRNCPSASAGLKGQCRSETATLGDTNTAGKREIGDTAQEVKEEELVSERLEHAG